MRELVLYTTLGCHLCEQAEALLRPVLAGYPECELILQDIADDEKLFALYGLRIPVLAEPGRTDDLGWPFDTVDIEAFLTSS